VLRKTFASVSLALLLLLVVVVMLLLLLLVLLLSLLLLLLTDGTVLARLLELLEILTTRLAQARASCMRITTQLAARVNGPPTLGL
jgi:hypothetical protein